MFSTNFVPSAPFGDITDIELRAVTTFVLDPLSRAVVTPGHVNA